MNDKMKLLLDKMKLKEELYSSFLDSTIEKIIINSKNNTWKIIIKNENLFPKEIIEELEENKHNIDQNIKDIYINYDIENIDLNILKEYFDIILNKLKDKLKIITLYEEALQIENDSLVLVVNNKREENKLLKVKEDIENFYKTFGYNKEIDIELKEEKSIQEEIEKAKYEFGEIEVQKQEETPKSSNKTYNRKNVKDPNTVLGRKIKGNPIPIKTILSEDNNVIIEGSIFAIEEFKTKSDLIIITLKVTDYTDSIYCKLFIKDEEEYNRLKKELIKGKWYKFSGYSKNDTFARELVLNIRSVEQIENKEEKIQDTAETKRVELHTHTKMSQMDGVADEVALVKQAINWGHKAIAITDHNGVQSFPHVYNYVKGYNKNLKEGKEPFTVIYGTELSMIDDNVDVVLRPTTKVMLEQTYIVFDLETTGFNAGGADSIIEIGAVKLQNGEIKERYDELINPGRPLPKKIIDVTSITDEMLEDKDNEENAVKRFKEFIQDYPLVAHNAKFDMSFLEMAYKKYNLGEIKNPVIDTLELSRTLDTNYARHSLSALVKRYDVPWDEEHHHRGDYDAEGTALVFHKMLKKLSNQNIEKMDELLNLVSKDEIHKYGSMHHVNILVQNKKGLKNLFKLVSFANTTYLYKTPRILRSEIEKYREGLLIGSGCYESEVFNMAKSKTEEELTNIIRFYDYVEVQPMDCYTHLIQTGDFANELELREHLKKIIRVTQEAGKIIVATGDVHHIRKEDKIFREIIVNQKVPGGGRHPLARKNITEIPSNHFRTTNEMLENFEFLGEDLAYEIVVKNPNKIASTVEQIEVIIDTGGVPFSPKIENSEEEVKNLVYDKAHSMYGDPLPKNIEERIENELSGIIGGGFDVIYLIAQKLVKKSNDDGYIVGSRGSVGSSFVATMMGITEVNPLPAHYLCKNCKYSEFENEKGEAYALEYSSGYDLDDKICPKCGEKLSKEGQDMPFATFLGFNADKVPDIDLNFSGDYQWKAHEYTKELFGIDNVYRAGTIGTVAEKTAFGFVKGYIEEKGLEAVRTAEIERLALGCTGVKRTTGQHPGGIVVIPGYMDVFDFTPFQFPADDNTSLWRTTHFDYHAIDEDVLKLDILGHDDPTVLRMLEDLSGIDVTTLPLDDKDVFELLCSPKSLGVTEEDIMCPTGTLGLPELGTKFVINMLEETKPKTFSELVKISGLSHGTDVWAGNASELIKNNIVPFKKVIGCRDDIMVSLINWGVEPLTSFKIMEFVRKGRASKEPEQWKEYAEIMRKVDIPEWYIESCHKIKYMFPKAHACAYVMSALRIAWFKVHQPINYYAAYFSVRISDFDIETMIKGRSSIKQKIEDILAKGYEATNKETGILESLKIALEASCRGFKFANISLEKSEATKFVIDETQENTLIPPFSTIDGLGITVAKQLVEAREEKPFLSIEDVSKRGKISKTLVEKMKEMGIFEDMPESNQLSLF